MRWQSKIQYNSWRPVTAIQLGDTDGRMGIHFRFADMASRSQGQRVSRWAYKYFPLGTYEEIDDVEAYDDGQDDDDAEYPK